MGLGDPVALLPGLQGLQSFSGHGHGSEVESQLVTRNKGHCSRGEAGAWAMSSIVLVIRQRPSIMGGPVQGIAVT